MITKQLTTEEILERAEAAVDVEVDQDDDDWIDVEIPSGLKIDTESAKYLRDLIQQMADKQPKLVDDLNKIANALLPYEQYEQSIKIDSQWPKGHIEKRAGEDFIRIFPDN